MSLRKGESTRAAKENRRPETTDGDSASLMKRPNAKLVPYATQHERNKARGNWRILLCQKSNIMILGFNHDDRAVFRTQYSAAVGSVDAS